MDHTPKHRNGMFDASDGVPTHREKDDLTSDGKLSSAPPYRADYDDATGEVYDPYGGKKLGMFRVCSQLCLEQIDVDSR